MRHPILIAFLLVWAMTAYPQEPVEEDLPTIKIDVNVVNVLCSVRNRNGGLVANLEQDDFMVLEDGKQQEIRYFARETDLPLTIGLLVDVSGSQESLIEIEKQAAERFFTEVLRKKDMAFLISFGSEAELLQDLTGSARLLREGLNQLRLSTAVRGIHAPTVPGATARGTILYDAVYLASEERLRHEVGRKVIVVISDGVDMGSRIRRENAIEVAQKSDAIIYSIYYSDPRYQSYSNGYGDLNKMSTQTGGRIFRVNKRNSLEYIFSQIQEEMRNQYSIGYSPTNQARDGSFRKLQIRMKPKGLKVQARQGYYAAKSE